MKRSRPGQDRGSFVTSRPQMVCFALSGRLGQGKLARTLLGEGQRAASWDSRSFHAGEACRLSWRAAGGSHSSPAGGREPCAALHLSRIPWQHFGGCGTVVLALCLRGSPPWDLAWQSPHCTPSAARAGSCGNICTKHEDGMWRLARTESRAGNAARNGVFKHLFYSHSKCMLSLHPADIMPKPADTGELVSESWRRRGKHSAARARAVG